MILDLGINTKKYLLKGSFGLEKESLRVNLKGYLSHTEHPFFDNPYIDRDFCENQVEMITDVCASVDDVYRDLTIIHEATVRSLYTLETGKEILWPFSNPPYVKNDDDIPVAIFQGDLKGKEYYRQYLAKKYGKKKMLFSGIYVNYSFARELLEEQWNNSNTKTLKEYQNNVYLKLAQRVVQYAWLIVYLTAASPVLDGSFFDDEKIGEVIYQNLGSTRCSEIGYWNDFVPILDYHSLDDYALSIQKYVDNGLLKATSELYYPVRLKPKGSNTLEHLKQNGINHIELRMLDLNPFSPINFMKEDLEFIHLLIVYLSVQEDIMLDEEAQKRAISNEKAAALYDDEHIMIEVSHNQSVHIRDYTLDILNQMEVYFEQFDDIDYQRIIAYQRDKIIHHHRYVERIKEEFSQQYIALSIKKAEDYAKEICQI